MRSARHCCYCSSLHKGVHSQASLEAYKLAVVQAYIKLPQHLRPGVNDLEGRLRGAWITPHEKDRDQYVLNEVGRQGRRAHNF